MSITAPAVAPVKPSIGKRPIPLTIDNVVQALELVLVERGPDYVYGDHFNEYAYRVEGELACIWGVALSGMGYDIDNFFAECIEEVIETGKLGRVSQTVRDAMAVAQCDQDCGMSYGNVVADFKKAVGRG